MADLGEDIARTFQRCPDCERYLVDLDAHTCRVSASSDPTREQRMAYAASDTRPDDDEVLLLPTRNVDGSYAYHERGADGAPACGGGGSRGNDGWITLTRREAKARGKSPCRTCRRLTDDASPPPE